MQIWSHLLTKSLMENFIFSAVEPAKHLGRNIEHEFGWYVLTNLPEHLKIPSKEKFWIHTL